MRIKTKLDLGLASVILAVLVPLSLVIWAALLWEKAAMVERLHASVANELHSLNVAKGIILVDQVSDVAANAFYFYDYKQLTNTIDAMMSGDEVVSINVFETDGTFQDNFDEVYFIDASTVDPDILASLQAGNHHVEQHITSTTVYAPINYNDLFIGGVKLSLSSIPLEQVVTLANADITDDIDDSAQFIALLLFASVFFILFPLSLFFQFNLLKRVILTPLSDITSFILNGAADSNVPVNLTEKDDEIGLVATALDTLTKGLRSRASEIEHIAYHDDLTGLPNNAYLRMSAKKWFDANANTNEKLGILLINVNNMKGINQAVGDETGDIALNRIAHLIKDSLLLKFSDQQLIVGRRYGDHFQALFPIKDEEELAAMGNYLRKQLNTSITLDGTELSITAGVGGLLIPDHAVNLKDLSINTETVLGAVRASSTKSYLVFNQKMAANVERYALIVRELEKCIVNRDIEVYYQSSIDLKTNEVRGAEALARWNHPELGFIPPDEFIPIAEQNNLILELSYLIIDKVCEQRAKWLQSMPDKFTIAINISPVQLTNKIYYNKIFNLVNSHKIAPHQIEIEITETAFLGSDRVVYTCLEKLKENGFKIWLDDFGTGFSSLSHLQYYPIDGIKIDRSFVTDIETNSNNLALVSALVNLGLKLDKEIVAEGVENSQQGIILKQLGAQNAQGYFYDKPLTAAAFEKKYFSASNK